MKQILSFILLSSLLCWLVFSPIYKHVLVVRQAVLQQEVDLLLEIGTNASYGYIDPVMLDASRQRLVDRGFQGSALIFTVRTTSGADGMDPLHPIIRGEGIQLTLSYPYSQLLQIDRLIGITPPSTDAVIVARGMKMSEYVPE